MKKILWLISGIVSAFLSGMFLYEGGKLFFWFHDRRGGVMILTVYLVWTETHQMRRSKKHTAD